VSISEMLEKCLSSRKPNGLEWTKIRASAVPASTEDRHVSESVWGAVWSGVTEKEDT